MSTKQNPLTLLLPIKSRKDFQELKGIFETMQGDENNPVFSALNKIKTVHFARFVFLDAETDNPKLLVTTTYDGGEDEYFDDFLASPTAVPVFNQILSRIKDAPPLPVNEHKEDFKKYLREENGKLPALLFYSAYPDKTVENILGESAVW
jgi:hypothetical protein